VTITGALQARASVPNMVLLIVAKNSGAVPVAVKRVVNPRFPVAFTLTREDLLVPGQDPQGPFTLDAELNAHGQAGAPLKGDLRGKAKRPVKSGEHGVEIRVDEEV
jgi:hypothetical protein